MANKKRAEAREKRLSAQRTERTIQYIGIGIVVLLVVAGIWYVLPKGQSQTPEAANGQVNLNYGSTEAVCAPFSDIPVADQYSEPPLKIDTSKQYFATV